MEEVGKINIKKLVLILFIFIISISFISCSQNNKRDWGSIIDTKLDAICRNNKNMESSNPYIYTKDSKEYKDIVNLGDTALKYMLSRFETSEDNGLEEYVMALACSEILRENTKDKRWASGREWYDNYTKSIKNNE